MLSHEPVGGPKFVFVNMMFCVLLCFVDSEVDVYACFCRWWCWDASAAACGAVMGNKLSCSCAPLIRKAYRYEDSPWNNSRRRDGHLLR